MSHANIADPTVAPGIAVDELPAQRHRSLALIRFIGIFKLVKAVALFAAGIGLITLAGREVAPVLQHWANALGVDPHGHYLNELLAKVGGMSPGTLRAMGVGTLCYAAVFTVEGVGLLARKVWAEYMTSIVTISFIPLEVYELIHKASIAKALVLVFNIAVVIYLVFRLRADHHWPFRKGMRLAKR